MEVAALGLRVDGVVDIDSASSSLDRFTKSSKSADQASGSLTTESRNTSKSLADVAREGDKSSASMSRLSGAAKAAAGAIAAALSVRQIQIYADAWSDLTSRIQVSIGPQQDAASVMQRLGDIARMTYSSLELTAESFAQNSTTLRALGKSTKDQLDYTEALNNALVVSGAKNNDAALVQNALSRSMAEGAAKGDDLNLILNYGSRVAELLAEELGTNVTRLRSFAKEGKITGDVIYSALVKNMETLAAEAESMPATIGDAFTLMRNAALQMVGVYDQANGLSEGLATALVAVADNLGTITRVLASAAIGWGVYQLAVNGTTIALTAARAAQLLFNSAAMLNPYVAAAAAIVAATSAIWMFRDATVQAGDGQARLKDYAVSAWNEMGGAAREFGSWISELWPQITDDASGAYGAMTSGFNDVVSAIVDRAYSMANTLITVFVGIAKTMVITAQTYVDTFVDAFNRIVGYAKAFGVDMSAALSGNFGFSAIREQMEKEVESPLLAMPGRIAGAWSDAASTDWLGEIGTGISNLGKRITEGAQSSYRLETALDGLIGKSDLFGFSVENVTGGVTNLSTETNTLTKSINDEISALERAVITWGMTADEVTLYTLAANGASDAQQLQAANALRAVSALDAQAEAQKRLRDEEARTKSDFSSVVEGLRTEEEAILASYENRKAIIEEYTRLTGEDQTEQMLRLQAERDEALLGATGSYWERWLLAAEGNLMSFDELSKGVIENFTRGFGDAFESAIFDAEDWGDALQGITQGIARGVVNAIGQMIAQEIALQTVKRLTGEVAEKSALMEIAAIAKTKAASLAATATTMASQVAAAATTFAAWLPAAIASSIGSFGAAAAIGIAAVVAGLALTSGFKEGGYTGNGGVSDIAGVVHGKEYVFDAASTARIGVDNLEAMRSGRAMPGNVVPFPTSAARAPSAGGLNLTINNNVRGVDVVARETTGENGDPQYIIDIVSRDMVNGGQTADAVASITGTQYQGS